MANEKIEVGDVVSIVSENIISDGLKMTVENITNNVALCIWYDHVNNNYKQREFPLTILKLQSKKD